MAMKKQLFIPLLAVSGLLAFQSQSFAQMQGCESFDSTIVLVATTNAPGASGCAKIEAEDDNGSVTNQMEVKTSGLPLGQYNVDVVKTSDGSTQFVGTITVGSEDDSEDGTNDWSVSGTNCVSMNWTNISLSSSNSVSGGGGTNTQSEDQFALPSGVDPTDIAQVIVADLGGNPMLIGTTNSSVSNCVNFNAAVQITAGPAAPNAQGVVVLQNHVNKGKAKSKFMLNATGLPGGTTLNVVVNGTVVGTVKTTKTGHAKLTKLPVNLLTVQSIELQDSGGVTAGSANF